MTAISPPRVLDEAPYGTLVEHVPLDLIDPGPNQRSDVEKADIEGLAASIRRMGGVINPIRLVRVLGRFRIVAGERRWRASKLAGMQTVAAIVVGELAETDAQQLALHENTQREALSPIDEARAYQRLIGDVTGEEGRGAVIERIAAELGKSRSHVYARLELLKLPESVQVGIHAGRIVAATIQRGLDGVAEPFRAECAKAIADRIESGREISRTDARKIVAEILAREGPPKRRVSRGLKMTPSRRRRMNDECMIAHAVRDFGTAIACTTAAKKEGRIPLSVLGALVEVICKFAPRAREALAEWEIHGRVTRQQLEETLHPGQLIGLAVHVALLTVVADAKDPVLEELAEELQLDLGRIRQDAINQVREELGEQEE